MIPNTNPAGLLKDGSLEIYVSNGIPECLYKGDCYPWPNFPEEIIEDLKAELSKDYKALKGLYILGIADPDEQLGKYTFCHFGDFDKVPDRTADGTFNPEYWDCGQRPCLADGLLCHIPEVPCGNLTPHETKIIRLVAQDLPNKTIADCMGVTLHTMNREVKNITRKINCSTKSGIASFAGRNNII